MAKDPAFLFYSKDWLEGTAGMSPEGRGIYITLLAHQHQKKTLPVDRRELAALCSVTFERFTQIWPEIYKKFVLVEVWTSEIEEFDLTPTLDPTEAPAPVPGQPLPIPYGEPPGKPYGTPLAIPYGSEKQPYGHRMVNQKVNRMVNLKLNHVVNQRSSVVATKLIVGCFAAVVKKNRAQPIDCRNYIKEKFNKADFEGLPKDELMRAITIWYDDQITSWRTIWLGYGITTPLANANTNSSMVSKVEKKEGLGDARGKGEKEEGEPEGYIKNLPAISDDGWNRFPTPGDLNGLPETHVQKTIELIYLTKKIKLTPEEINSFWDIFKVAKLTGKNIFADMGKVHTYFFDWMRKQDIAMTESGRKKSISERRKEKFGDGI